MRSASLYFFRSRVFRSFMPALCAALLLTGSATASTVGPKLSAKLNGLAGSASMGTVIVAFNTSNGLNASHLSTLTLAGITRGYLLKNLGMVAAPATAAQVRTLAASPSVRSIWSNDRLVYLNDQTRVLTGVDRVRDDPEFTQLHQGLPVSGQGNFSVLVNDSGIDGTHPDLLFPGHLLQNVLGLTDTQTLTGFTPDLFVENVPDTDTNVGHGTHCAGIVAGTGAASGGKYAGVAPGANLIGYGSGAVLFILNGLGGFEYALAKQATYNIRVISNSWGGQGAFDPSSPIAIASKLAHDRGIVVLFAAGNSGPGKDTMSAEAKAPWVISVAAGTKEGGLASFSSRGVPKSDRPTGDFNAPTITAPGTGREFASDSGRFTSDIVSTRSKTNVFANGEISAADAELAPADLPFYTEISGTSMATPFVAGTVALLLSVDPTLTPDAVKAILTQTASQMPGFSEYEVGAGYLNVYAAVDKAFHRNKPYGSYGGPLDLQSYNLTISSLTTAEQPFHIDYNPVATPGAGSSNSTTFTVAAGISVLDVFAGHIDDALSTGNGNTIGLLLTAPDGKVYSSGVALPILDAPNREVVVNNPVPGSWRLEIRGVRGLAALPEVSLPTSGAALPGPVDGTITQRVTTLPAIADIQGDPAQAEIELVLKNRMMDVLSDGLFHPAAAVTRGSFAQTLVFNTALRQSLPAVTSYTDVTGSAAAIAEAVTAEGSTLRDYDFTPTGMLAASGSNFNPDGTVTRTDLAVALVKALGLDQAAAAKAGSDVTVTYDGQSVVVSDEAEIPPALRGYVQLALDRGILNALFSLQQGPADPRPILSAKVLPTKSLTRSFLAFALDHYRQAFAAGN